MIGAQSFSQLMLPSLMGEIVANITGPTGADNSFILRKGLEMIAYAGATIIIAFATSIGISYVGAYFGKKLRAEVFKKVLSFSPGDYDRIGTASLMTRTTNDVEMVQTVVVMGLRIMVMSPIIMAIAIVQVLRTDVQLAIILAFSIPLIIITIIILFAIAMPLFKKLQIAIDEVTKVLRASLTGVRVVRAFNQEEKEKERFAKVNRHQTNLIIKVGRTMSFASPIISIFFDLTYFAIFLFGFAIIDGTANDARLDNILVTSQYAMHIMMSFLMFSMLLINIPRAGVSARRINEVLETKVDIVDPEVPHSENIGEIGHVRFEDVTFTFPDSKIPTLQNITFDAKPGQVTAIIGSTGSGKSSIINLIPRFYDVSKGRVLVDNVDVRDYTQKDLRDKIGFVPQQALLFSGTIRDNMHFGKPDGSDEEIRAALEVAQAARFVARKENGYDAEVSQGGKNFSGGQKPFDPL